MKITQFIVFLLAAVGLVGASFGFDHPTPGMSPGMNGARYATDAYPGFDSEDEMIKPERKEPRWFSFITGPTCETAKDQMAYCITLIKDGKYEKACRQLDALVRQWPTAPEAPKAQQALAQLLFKMVKNYEEAFAEYRYLLDFYSLQCDYEKIADLLYQIAGILKIEGKEVMFIRFENTVDVRRTYETCILRAPGAKWVPEAMLIIASLREDEGNLDAAKKVYENLRNLYPESDEAKTAIVREASVRMTLLQDYGYNLLRCQDTALFLELALRTCRVDDKPIIEKQLTEAKRMCEESAYRAATFYDSSTRTKRSAVNAYERFLADYPQSEHTETIRQRLSELKGEQK